MSFVYLIPHHFWKKSVPMSTLFDSSNEVNAIYPTFAQELGFFIKPMNVGAQKIDSTMIDTYRMVVAAFLVTDNTDRVKFCKKTFLMANVSLEVVLRMLFLTLSNANIDFLDRKLC